MNFSFLIRAIFYVVAQRAYPSCESATGRALLNCLISPAAACWHRDYADLTTDSYGQPTQRPKTTLTTQRSNEPIPCYLRQPTTTYVSRDFQHLHTKLVKTYPSEAVLYLWLHTGDCITHEWWCVGNYLCMTIFFYFHNFLSSSDSYQAKQNLFYNGKPLCVMKTIAV